MRLARRSLGLAALAASAQAQERPLRLIVPFAAGGGADAVARAVAAALGAGVVIENRPGGAGNIGTELAAAAPADGSTLLLTGPSHVVNAHLFRRLPYDPLGDFAPVSLLTEAPYLLVADPALKLRGLQDLIALARAKPGALAYGSAGNGTAGHLAMEMLKSEAGIDLTHVPYRGSPALLTDLMAGRVAVGFDNLLTSRGAVEAGQLAALGSSGDHRAAPLPQVQTLAEQGLPGFVVTVWQGVLAPVRTPPEIVAQLAGRFATVMRTAAMQERMAQLGAEAIGSTPAAFARFLAEELRRWGPVVQRSGARLD